MNYFQKRKNVHNLATPCIFMITVLSLSLLPYVFSQAPSLSVVEAQETNEITLYGSAILGWGFTEGSMSRPGPQIEFQEGQLYNMTLISTDGLTHKFYVDYNGNGTPDNDEPVSPDFSSTINFQFTPNKTGEFTYYCHYHPNTMYGNVNIIPEFSLIGLILVMVVLGLILVVYKRN